jgi:hypothetical protein
MAVETLGSEGLKNANLIIPQGSTMAFSVIHKNSSGEVIDHTTSEIKMALQSKNGASTYDMSRYCVGSDACISVFIPSSVTIDLPKGKLLWDMFAETEGGEAIRLAYGVANIVDTYALDGE